MTVSGTNLHFVWDLFKQGKITPTAFLGSSIQHKEMGDARIFRIREKVYVRSERLRTNINITDIAPIEQWSSFSPGDQMITEIACALSNGKFPEHKALEISILEKFRYLKLKSIRRIILLGYLDQLENCLFALEHSDEELFYDWGKIIDLLDELERMHEYKLAASILYLKMKKFPGDPGFEMITKWYRLGKEPQLAIKVSDFLESNPLHMKNKKYRNLWRSRAAAFKALKNKFDAGRCGSIADALDH